jgi:hypothetical protein
MNRPMYDASRDAFPTEGQRKKLIDAALEFAHLLPPGGDRARFLEVARSLSFLAHSAIHADDDPVNQQSTAHRGRSFSIARGPNNVVEINMSSALLDELKQQAQVENVPLPHALTTWVKRAINAEGIGLH